MTASSAEYNEVRWRVAGTDEAWSVPLRVAPTADIEIPGLDRTKQYDFEIRSVSNCGAKSIWVPSGYTVPTVPPLPAVPIPVGSGRADGVQLEWGDGTSTSTRADLQYEIQRAPAAGSYVTTPPPDGHASWATVAIVGGTTWLDAVTDTARYWYRIRTVDYAGNGGLWSILSAPVAASISTPELAEDVVSATALALAADAKAAQEIIDRQIADAKVLLDAAQDAASKVRAEAEERAAEITIEARARADAIAAEATIRAAAITAETTARINAINAEAAARAQALLDEATARGDAVGAVASDLTAETTARVAAVAQEAQSRIDGLAAEASARTIAVAKEVTDRTAAINAEAATRAQALLDEAAARGTAITSEAAARANADGALSTRIDTTNAAVGANAAAIAAETTARADADTAEATQRTTLATQMRGSYAGTDLTQVATGLIYSERQARVTADDAIAGDVSALQASTAANAAAITGEATARANADGALSTRVDTVTATANAAATKASLTAEQTARADADSALGTRIDTTNATVAGNTAAIAAETTARASADSAEANTREMLATQMRGGYTGSDLNAVTSGLIFQEKSARSTQYESVVQQVSLLSVGVGESFDYAKMYYFTDGMDGWTGNGVPTWTSSWLRPANHATDPYVVSPDALAVGAGEYQQVRVRVRRTGSPVWDGFVYWQVGAESTWDAARRVSVPEPTYDANGIGVITVNLPWAGVGRRIRIDLSAAQTAAAYFELDWVAVGRPAPGASSAALANEATARASADQSEVTARETLSVKLVGSPDPTGTTLANLASGLLYDERTARVAADTAEVTARQALAATVADNTAAISTESTARTNADSALSTRVDNVQATADNAATKAQLTVEQAARADDDSALGTRIDTVTASAAANAAAITSEATARSDADGALGTRVDVVTTTANNAATKAQLTTETTARTTADTALGARIDTVTASAGDNAASIAAEAVARTDADGALSTRIDTVIASAGANTAAIASEATARANADLALGTRIDTTNAAVGANAAAITGEATARANADGALSTRVDTVTATANAAATKASLTAEQTARADADSAMASDLALLGAHNASKSAFILDQDKVQVDASTTFAQKMTALATADSTNATAITSEATARTTADGALGTRIDAVKATADGAATTAQLTAEQTARANADGALGSRIDTTNAAVGANAAAIAAETTARADADTAEATQRTTLATQMRGSYAGTDLTQVATGLIYSERQARVTADDANAQVSSGILARMPAGAGKVASEASVTDLATSTATATSAVSNRVGTVEARMPAGTGVLGTESAVTTAQNAAQAASDLAGSKGKVIYGAAAPAAADRQPENLWIDTTGGANTPKRWTTGTTWVAVTDKAATDAAAAAAAALSHSQAVDARVTTVESASVSRDNALGTRASAIETRMPSGTDKLANEARVVSAESASVTRDNALSVRVGTVEARMPSGTGGLATAASVSAAEQAAATANAATAASVSEVRAARGDSDNLVAKSRFDDGQKGAWPIVSAQPWGGAAQPTFTHFARINASAYLPKTYEYLIPVKEGDILDISCDLSAYAMTAGGVYQRLQLWDATLTNNVGYLNGDRKDSGTPGSWETKAKSLVVPAGVAWVLPGVTYSLGSGGTEYGGFTNYRVSRRSRIENETASVVQSMTANVGPGGAFAQASTMLNVNNYVTGVRQTNNGVTSDYIILGENFGVVSGRSSNTMTWSAANNGVLQMIAATSGGVLRMGGGFGADADKLIFCYNGANAGTTAAQTLAQQKVGFTASGKYKLGATWGGVGSGWPTGATASYTSTASSATINVAAGTFQIGDQTISYNASSISVTYPGISPVRYYLYFDDAGMAGGSTPLKVSSNAATQYNSDGRVLISTLLVEFKSGGGGSGPPACVCVDSVLPGFARADAVQVGDYLRLVSGRRGQVWCSQTALQPCVRVTTTSGIELECSESAPILTDSGECVLAAEIDGHSIWVSDFGDERYEAASIERIGERAVQRITCEDDVFLAGKQPGRYIGHHNIKVLP